MPKPFGNISYARKTPYVKKPVAPSTPPPSLKPTIPLPEAPAPVPPKMGVPPPAPKKKTMEVVQMGEAKDTGVSTSSGSFHPEALKVMEEKIQKEGYVTVNVSDIYYYTLGFGKDGYADLITTAVAPFLAFQIAADLYHRKYMNVGEPFHIKEVLIKGMGSEWTRSRLDPLHEKFVEQLVGALSNSGLSVPVHSFLYLSLPDVNNRLYGEEPCLFKSAPEKMLSDALKLLKKS